ncbi:MAG: NADH-quinone oxidoreductase subunit G [Actinomycetota bacterium]
MSDNGHVTLTVDGKEVTVPQGTLIIRAAEQLGIEIPRFCDHPYLEPIGACRQCYVEVEGERKLLTSCTTTVTDGMVVKSQNTSGEAREAQIANLEFLLLNHPLDCPVCDRGGECPLQDQALEFGPGESRFIEAKRNFEKPIALSPLVALDRERCVLCARCTRFCDEISGDRFIELFDRGAEQQVAIAGGEDFKSPFSGNTIQICPVGALTAVPYRFAARPFDLKSADTVCPHCSSGCNIRVDMRRGEVVRVLARDNPEVNDEWICDKGRFAFQFADSPDRVTTPLLRRKGLEPSSFDDVFAAIAEWSKGKKVAFLTGGRLMDEDYYALSKLARTVFKTNDLDHRRVFGSTFAEVFAASPSSSVSNRDVERASLIVVVGLDSEQESPILHLRIRKAARRGAKIFVVHSRLTRLSDVAEHILARPGEEGKAMESSASLMEALKEAGASAVVLAGQQAGGQADIAEDVARAAEAKFAYVCRRVNDHGALRAGVHPELLPGARFASVGGDRAEVEAVWGALDLLDGVGNAWEILRAAAAREIDVLYLIGVDPLNDFPDAALARKALENVEYKVVQDLRLGEYEIFADAFLPAAATWEKTGHFTNWEGRGQRIRPVRGAGGLSRPDWEIFAGLADAMGKPLGLQTLEDLHEEMGRLLEPTSRVVNIINGDKGGKTAGLTLFTYPLLVDEGILSEGADELKAAQEQASFVEIHPGDAGVAGIEDGADVIVKTEAGQATLPARVTEHIAKGSVFVPYNQPGFRANTLLSGSFTTAVEIAPAAAREPEEEAS